MPTDVKASFYRVVARTLGALDKRGPVLRYPYPDRRMLEDTVLPSLARESAGGRVLLVGCAWYTRHYPGLLGGTEVLTMEIDPAKAAFGGTQHLVANMADIASHIAPESLDAIVCNGVLGWGLDAPADVESAFSGAVGCLRPGGLILLGWNDVAPRNAYPPARIAALAALETVIVPGLDAHRVVASARNQHCYQAFRKPGAMASAAAVSPENWDQAA